MNARQIAMDLPRLEAQGAGDFMPSQSNARARAMIGRWPDWPDRRLALIGPAGSGKSHLAAIWAAEAGARRVDAADLREDDAAALASGPVLVEDADRDLAGRAEGERALFHLWNAAGAAGAGLLLTGRRPPAEWPVALPDLASRLASLTPVALEQPDEALLSGLLVKLFADRQVAVRPGLVRYLVPRMERSFAAAQDMVARLDRESLAQGKAPDIALARTLLEGPNSPGD